MRTLLLLTLSAGCGLAQIMSGVISAGGNAPTTLATPTDSPGAGTYGSTQSVTLSGPAGATICYTTNGTTPGAATPGTCDGSPTTTYSGAISVSATTTIKAIATKAASINSGVLTSAYTITVTHTYTVQTATAAAVTANPPSTSCAFSPASQLGDLIVVAGINTYTSGNGSTVISASDNGSSSYSVAANDTLNFGSYGNQKVLYAWNVASGITTVTLDSAFFSTASGVCYLIHDSASHYTVDPLDQAGVIHVAAVSGGSSYTFGSITPTVADGIVIETVADQNEITTAWTGTGAGWTTGANVISTYPLFSQYKLNAAIAAYAPVITTTGSGTAKFQGTSVVFRGAQ